MLLSPAVELDYLAIVDLANQAYRGTGPVTGWSTEAAYIEGLRLTEAMLRADLAAKPDAHLMVLREAPNCPFLGTVWLEATSPETWYLGLLTIRPDIQNRQLGRTLLTFAEDFVKEQGGIRIRMTVVSVRDTLIAWYQRRGYCLTGQTQPFPYGDERFGRPLRDDMHFAVLEKELRSKTAA